MIKLTFRKVKF